MHKYAILILTGLLNFRLETDCIDNWKSVYLFWASQVALVVKNTPANARDVRDTSSIPGSGRSPGREHGNPVWYSCLENPMDRGAWQATVHGVAKSWTQLKRLSMHVHLSHGSLCHVAERMKDGFRKWTSGSSWQLRADS